MENAFNAIVWTIPYNLPMRNGDRTPAPALQDISGQEKKSPASKSAICEECRTFKLSLR